MSTQEFNPVYLCKSYSDELNLIICLLKARTLQRMGELGLWIFSVSVTLCSCQGSFPWESLWGVTALAIHGRSQSGPF